ncbi:MAG: hypothetical protein AAB426_03470 [Myxococcota bacterium]
MDGLCAAWGLSLVLTAASTGTGVGHKIAVLKIPARVGIDQARIDIFSEFLQNELRARGYVVVGHGDIEAMVDFESKRQLLTCDEAACLAEIGGALGVGEVVNGSVAVMGPYLLITLKRTSPRDAQVLAQSVRKLEHAGDKELLDAIGPMVDELYGSARPGDVSPEVLAVTSSRAGGYRAVAPWVLMGLGGVGVAIGGYFELAAIDHNHNAQDASYVGGQLEVDRAKSAEKVAWAAGLTGLGFVAAGVVTRWLGSADSGPMLAVTPAASGLGLAVAGRY